MAGFVEFLWFKVHRPEKLERRAETSKQSGTAPAHSSATYTDDSREVIVTEPDVAALRAQLTRPYSSAAVRELALVYKLAEQEDRLHEEEQDQLFWENIEAIRAEAIATGTAIDDPAELLADD